MDEVGLSTRGTTGNLVSSSTVHNLVQAHQIQNLYLNTAAQPRTVPRQVPGPTPVFTDRGPTLAAVDLAVTTARDAGQVAVVGFHGPPGVGKRTVARHWLHAHAADHPDGAFHADLGAGPADPGLVAGKLREFLLEVGYTAEGLPGTADGLAARFRSWSAGRRIAIVLENVWSAAQIRPFLPAPGGSTVLFTSPGRINGLFGERAALLEVPLLDPAFAGELLAGLIGAERVAAEPAAVRDLIDLCDGLPMAMWVLAATTNARPSRPLSRLLDDLHDTERRRRVLGAADPGTEHDVSVFADAFRRLGPTARACCRALHLHPGPAGATVPALAAGLGLPADQVRDALDEIRDLHLAEETERDGTQRYRLHQLIGWHLPDGPGDADGPGDQVVLRRMLAYYTDNAVRAGHAMMPLRGWDVLLFPARTPSTALTSLTSEQARAWLEAERSTLRACVESLHRQGDSEDVCLLAVMLWPLHEQGKHLADQIAVNQLALEAADRLGDPALVALIRTQLGFPHLHLGQPEQAEPLFEQALTPARASGRPELEATVLEALGLARLALGKTTDAREVLRENLSRALDLGQERRVALARLHLARAETPQAAVPLLGEALSAFEALDPPDGHNAAKTRIHLGRALTGLGSYDEAAGTLNRALTALTALLALRRPFDCVLALEALGDLGLARNDPRAAVTAYQDALAVARAGDLLPEVERLTARLASAGRHDGLDDPSAEPNP
ncbi:tetratricopeptide repeat protein [Kineosporia sp. J2-2]|uniref:Tetratricopeptide repeat protein n=1 Tax=Kineosporia corallincola TaxID=2835133 RepID=A0ABS5TRW8_9ACTN|nr:tetratricopeptide repeat protein [Kineosporia corallincola]MBT0773529.1 tetratricopeptide repeat protein [Kineosporia corallincola]